VLALPLVQALKQHDATISITVVATPTSAGVLRNHPAVDHIVEYDKRRRHRGVAGIRALARTLAGLRFDVALIPHRSLRSALVVRLAHIPRRIGFANSAGRFLFTDRVPYVRNAHEIRRNLNLLEPLGVDVTVAQSPTPALPSVYPSAADEAIVDRWIEDRHREDPAYPPGPMVGLAPGSIWFTKRWPLEYYIELARRLRDEGHGIALLGGPDDVALCAELEAAIGHTGVLNACGSLSLLQSASLMRRCALVVANDSAPMHLAVAVDTPVVAIFGPTVPAFGFAPLGERDVVVETMGLTCRPCGAHGGKSCPIGTFECMKAITPERVLREVHHLLPPARPAARGPSPGQSSV
jgi:heptosyltransferase-2